MRHLKKIMIAQLKASQTVLLASHIQPDGDALGSTLALGLFLESLGKSVTFYNENAVPAMYRFLPGRDRLMHRITRPERYDTLVVLDCSDIRRVGRLAAQADRFPLIINIDHHVTNTRFGDTVMVDETACAAAQIVYSMIKDCGAVPTLDMAYNIYTAILTDTGSFRFQNTNQEAFSICQEMIAIGVDPYKVAQHVYGTYSLGRIKLLNRVLESIEISDNGKLSIMTLTREMLAETGATTEEINGLVNYAKRIQDVQVAMLIYEQDQPDAGPEAEYVISIRSNGEVDVSTIATAFGGGGHPTAAGFSIKAPLNDVRAHMISLADSF